MTTTIVVLTPDKSISTLIGVRKTALIPSDIRKKYPHISIGSIVIEPATTLETISNFFVRTTGEGVIALCDNRLAHLVNDLATPLFTVIYDHTLGGKSLQNYFWMILSKVIRAFAVYEARFDLQATRKLLILPLRNFSSDELRELHGLFRNGVEANGNFHSALDRLLKALRNRQKPKVQTDYRKTYIVDDGERYFEYGMEVHAPLETGVPPHNWFCAVAGTFRFGKRYDPKRHFNLSRQGAQISGTFQDCHGSSAGRGPCSHINMFPNDFFGAN
jgi:hypothetical protein